MSIANLDKPVAFYSLDMKLNVFCLTDWGRGRILLGAWELYFLWLN